MISLKTCVTMLLCLLVTNNLLLVTCSSYFYNLVSVNNCNCFNDSSFEIASKLSLLERVSNCTTLLNKSPYGDYNHRGDAIRVGTKKHNLRQGKYHFNNEADPFLEVEALLNNILFGEIQNQGVQSDDSKESSDTESRFEALAHYPSGHVMRAELFENKSGVHLPLAQLMHKDHSFLKVTQDHMQTAVNAFAIFLEGTVEDIFHLPPLYLLHSARLISMMKVAREKLVATWDVIKGDLNTEEISYQTLEMYRPLFKYINGREIAKLNLSDERILSYIGTHADLDRHQVGVVASKYIKLNKSWNNVKYLNIMNNLLCGVPMLYMRTLEENTYLQLSHQIFYHIRSCDPLQRRFFLHIMTKTQVLGRSNSWSASDVARLGLLLTEVDAPELSAINPQAMSGITAQVMMEMAPQNLKYISDAQLKYISHKPMNILAKKLHAYEDQQLILNSGSIIPYWGNIHYLRIHRIITLVYIYLSLSMWMW